MFIYLSIFCKIGYFAKLYKEYSWKYATLAYLILLPYLVLELTPGNHLPHHQFFICYWYYCQSFIGRLLNSYSFSPHLVYLLYHRLYVMGLLMIAHSGRVNITGFIKIFQGRNLMGIHFSSHSMSGLNH